MKSQGVKSTVAKALTTGLVAAALLFAVPAKSHAQVAVGVQFGQPVYGYTYADGRQSHWEHEEHERAEAYARQQAWEQQQAWNRQQAWEQQQSYQRQQAWARQQQYLRHEAWEHNEYRDRDRGYDHHDGDRDRGDERDGNHWR